MLESWYAERVREIDAKSGLLSNSQALINHAINVGLTSLGSLSQVCKTRNTFFTFIYALQKIEELYTLVYYDEAEISLEEYRIYKCVWFILTLSDMKNWMICRDCLCYSRKVQTILLSRT